MKQLIALFEKYVRDEYMRSLTELEAWAVLMFVGWLTEHYPSYDAAPKLLEALEEARRALGTLSQNALGRDSHLGHYYRDELISEISSAIAEARGE